MVILEVEPVLRAGPENAGEPERRVGRDTEFSVDDALDAGSGNLATAGKASSAHAEWNEEFLLEDFARMNRADARFDSQPVKQERRVMLNDSRRLRHRGLHHPCWQKRYREAPSLYNGFNLPLTEMRSALES
jgi:hypothetical protein